jgi:phospholipase C
LADYAAIAMIDDPLLLALRLGWAMAEARGRYRLWDSPRLVPAGALPSRRAHALPLADERSTSEQRIEVEHVLWQLAVLAGVDPDHTALTGESPARTAAVPSPAPAPAPAPAAPTAAASDRLSELAVALNAAHGSGSPGEVAAAWDAVAQHLYLWDAYIQDQLASRAFGTASAYQLGRSLAETYWALDPTALPDDPASWEVVLGAHRREEITHLLSRLGARFPPLTVQSITFSVAAWATVAADPSWRSQPDMVAQLGLQARLWRDLLLTGRDPETLLDATDLLRRSRQVRGLLAAFWPEIVGLALTLLLLSGAVYVLTRPGGGHTFAAALAILGSVGVTASGLAARAKSAAQGVMAHLQQTLYQDAIDASVTLRPEKDRQWGTGPIVPPDPLRPVDHVIVLVLENRSFDHMLGYLDHPDPGFDGLLRGRTFTNPGWDSQPVEAAPHAKRVLPVDPDHSHDAVMEQLGLAAPPKGRKADQSGPTNSGFVTSYERKGRGLAVPRFGGLFGFLGRMVATPKPENAVSGRGSLAMLCQPPGNVPALSALAKGFGVCTRWFCSVPGETWPNRNFLHAASSDGETNIDPRFYKNPTIFELLERRGVSWHIYHDDTPQIWAFINLWDTPERHANWFELAEFAGHVAADRLPAYSFIEPNHKPPLHTMDHAPLVGVADVSNNQHPGNNLVSNAAYDTWPDDLPTDFARAESLVASVYEALRANPTVFERSLLLITYDEHGGLFDHVPPPTGVPGPGSRAHPIASLLSRLYRRESSAFDFTMLGPRVPAIVVSPYVSAGTVDTVVRDHASVPSTLRTLFAAGERPLTPRDAWAPPFSSLLNRKAPRRGTDLPDLSAYAVTPAAPAEPAAPPAPAASAPNAAPIPAAPAHYDDLVALSGKVRTRLVRRGLPEARAAAHGASMVTAEQVSDAFRAGARRAREDRNRA